MAARTRRPIARPSAFWDASALVPLFARQGRTAQAFDWYARYEIVVWWATPVEIAGALARLLRMRDLDLRQWGNSFRSMIALSETWITVSPGTPMRAKAIQLVERHDLRAGDALQLAAALEWCEGAPHGKAFLSVDDRLREAALLCGFDTEHD